MGKNKQVITTTPNVINAPRVVETTQLQLQGISVIVSKCEYDALVQENIALKQKVAQQSAKIDEQSAKIGKQLVLINNLLQ